MDSALSEDLARIASGHEPRGRETIGIVLRTTSGSVDLVVALDEPVEAAVRQALDAGRLWLCTRPHIRHLDISHVLMRGGKWDLVEILYGGEDASEGTFQVCT